MRLQMQKKGRTGNQRNLSASGDPWDQQREALAAVAHQGVEEGDDWMKMGLLIE